MHPHRRLLPRGGQGPVPYSDGGPGVDVVGQQVNRGAGLLIPGRQRAAAEGAVLPGRRPAAGVSMAYITAGNPARSQRRTRPGPGARARPRSTGTPTTARGTPPLGRPSATGLGNRQRQLGGQDRQPPVLLGHLRYVVLTAGQANGELTAQPERGVVPPAEPDRDHRQPGPLRKLTSDQPGCDLRGDLVPVHYRDHAPDAQRGHPDFGPAAAPAWPSVARFGWQKPADGSEAMAIAQIRWHRTLTCNLTLDLAIFTRTGRYFPLVRF